MMNARYPTLSNRLAFLMRQVGIAKRVIDVGTDHAALPIALVKNELCECAVGTDINCGPYAAALRNVRAAGLTERIDIILTDGLSGISLRADDTIVIAGMGGMEMAHILENVEIASKQRYLLQPNWTWTELRTFLSARNATICHEAVILDRDKLYPYLEVRFDGQGKQLNYTECYAGPDLMRQFISGRNDKLRSKEEHLILTRYFERLLRLSSKRAIGDERWRHTAADIERLLHD